MLFNYYYYYNTTSIKGHAPKNENFYIKNTVAGPNTDNIYCIIQLL